MKRSIRLLIIVTVASGILVGAVAGPVSADQPTVDDETDENEMLTDFDLDDFVPGGDRTSNNVVDVVFIGY